MHAGAGGVPPTPVRKLGGRVLLCTLTDLPREIELPSVVPGTCEPENDGETVFIVMHRSSNATHPVDIDDKIRPKEPCPRNGETVGAALGESGGSSHVHRMHHPLGRRVREVLPRAVSFVSSHLSLARKSVLWEEMGALA